MTVALLVCAAPVAGTEQLVAALSSEADLVVGVDGGAAVCLAAGVVPDLVVGDLDSLDMRSAAALEERGVPVRLFPSDKDQTDIDLAIEAVRTHGIGGLVVTGAFAGRLDHTLAAIGSLVRAADLQPAIREPRMSAWLLHPEHRGSVVLENPGATVSILPLAGDAVVSCDGVKWPLGHARVAPLSSFGVSNVISAERAHVIVHEGVVLVMSEAVGYTSQAAESA